MKQIHRITLFILINIAAAGNVLIAQHSEKESHPGTFYTVNKNYDNSNLDGYNLYIPNSCTKDSKAFPLIVFLQGGLGVGGKVDAIFNWELPKELKETKKLKNELDSLKLNTFIYVMPHISRGQFYTNEEAIKNVIEEVSANYNVDKQRIYLTGLSRGGHGTWGLASRISNTFAAIAPIAGAPHGVENYENLTGIPILTAHNIADKIVRYDRTKNTIQRIEEKSNKRFYVAKTISEIDYENHDLIFISGEDEQKGHNAWTDVYNSTHFYKWLLRFDKK